MIFRRFIDRLNDRTGGAVEYESRRWHLECPKCGRQKSYWDLGGARYKAASHGKRTLGRCSHCGKWRWLRTVWIDPPPGEASDPLAKG